MLSGTISQTEKFSSSCLASLQTTGTLQTPNFFYQKDKTEVQLLEPRFKQWNIFEKGAII